MGLDSQTQSCMYLSPDDGEYGDVDIQTLNSSRWRDFPGGYERRLGEYKTAWSSCLRRMQNIVRVLHVPLAVQIAEEVKSSYLNPLPGLPYPEVPVIALSAETGSPIFSDLVSQLAATQDADSLPIANGSAAGDTPDIHITQVHLHPSDCPNLLAMMKAIVVGFTSQSAGNEKQSRSAASLANYDIARLEAWYCALDGRPNLAVFLHEFEQFEVAVVQDAFYICSLHVPRVPLVFVLGLTSPSTPTYLHKAYPRSTLALLRVRTFTAPSGTSVADEVVAKTFFDPSFEPPIMIGPATLDFLRDFTSRHTASLDALYTILQLAHMKHFTEPLTALAGLDGATADIDLASDSARPFSVALAARLRLPDGAGSVLLDAVDAAREAFRGRAHSLRVGLAAAEAVRSAARTKADGSFLQFASAVLRGRADNDIEQLGLAVQKLPEERLRGLVEHFMDVLAQVEGDGAGYADEGPRGRLNALQAQLVRDHADENDTTDGPLVASLAREISNWLMDFLEQCFARLDEGPLWDVWYMGNTPFPAELINPAPRLSVISALMHPDDFVRAHSQLTDSPPHDEPAGADVDVDVALRDLDEDEDGVVPALWQLPDASILFRRYVDAGRMVNVFDWFQSFAVVLESQWRHLRRRDQGAGEPASGEGSPTTNGARVHAAARRGERRDGGDGDESSEYEDGEEQVDADSEEWRAEVQARFIRALHTLDHMGLVRHTGRKADHIIRTVYDVLD